MIKKQTYPQVVPPKLPVDDGLVLYLPFQEGSGRFSADLSGFGKNGTLDGALWGAAKGGKGFAPTFDGTNDFATGSDAALPSGSSARTILMWTRLNLLKDYQSFFFYGTTIAYQGLLFSTGNGASINKLLVGIYGENAALSTGTISINSWHQLGVSISAGGAVTYFINGSVAGTGLFTHALNTTLNQYKIGDGWNASDNCNGQVKNIRIYNRVLSTDGLRKIYEAEK